MSSAKTTTNHAEIKAWVEARGGVPSRVKGTGGDGDPGMLRIDFPGFSGEETLEQIDWETFFDAFEDNELAFLHQDRTSDGSVSRFCKFVARPKKRVSREAGAERR